MPVAVFNYLFALKSGKHVDIVASLVMISTVMSIVLLPFVLGQLM
jgi:predicted permease